MKIVIYTTCFIVLIILFNLQTKLRKPIFNKVSNVWNEDKEGVLMADAILVVMLTLSFILGLNM